MSDKAILVVGAGLSGVVVARELAETGRRVTVIDKRPHVAGNAYDFVNEFGIRIHRYGPHLFHTSNAKVAQWLSRFTEWLPYRHKVKALLGDGRLVTLPVNRETLAIVGRQNIVDTFYRPYTRKMWDMEIEQLDPDILNRVSVREDDNELYFPDDTFQALPAAGYTALVESILEHENIEVRLNCAFTRAMTKDYDHVFNSMPIDEYFDFELGALPYRSIRFHHQTVPLPLIYPVATVNFTHAFPFTRVTEWKHLPGNPVDIPYTSITVEEPCSYLENNHERYYPVKDIDGANRDLYRRYKERVPSDMTFIGRCGQYVYLNMDQAVSAALAIAAKWR